MLEMPGYECELFVKKESLPAWVTYAQIALTMLSTLNALIGQIKAILETRNAVIRLKTCEEMFLHLKEKLPMEQLILASST